MLNKEIKDVVIDVANANDIEPALLLAIVEVESAGVAFWKVGNKNFPPVRFEGHYFYKRLSGNDLDKAVKQGLANSRSGVVKNPRSFTARYAMINKAAEIDTQAAYESTSWGLGQVMGAHWKALGYKSVQDLVDHNNTIQGQVDAIVRYLRMFNVLKPLREHKFAVVAKMYNGSNYRKNKYDTKIRNAYNKYLNGAVSVIEYTDIIDIQTNLNIVGQYGIFVDGIMDTPTLTALKDFQLKQGLIVDGIYGPITRSELENAVLKIKNEKDNKVGTSASSAGAAGTAIAEVAKQIEPLINVSQALQYVFIGLLIVGLIFSLKPLLWSK